jgi:CBS-domain-containing membrane protein
VKRTVEDVMSKDVVVARDDMTVKAAAALLRGAGVGAAPVVDEGGRCVGIVSEGDLLLKSEGGSAGRHHSRLAVMPRSREMRKGAARTVRELKTRPAVTVRPDEPLAAAARRMHERDVKQLPVVDDTERVVGIVSRSDLMKVFLLPDRAIRDDVVHEVLERCMSIGPETVWVAVEAGVVTLEGKLESRSVAETLIELVRERDGVVDVVSRLSWEVDDAHARSGQVTPWGALQGMRFSAHGRSRSG